MTPAATVALVGCGRWGRNILRDLVALGARTLVVDPDPAARAAALVGGAAAALAELEALPAADGAVVATPTRTHAAAVAALLDRDLPVFCEKPLTADPDSAARLAARAPHRLFVMDKWRYHPGIEALAAIARDGALGPVHGLRSQRHGGEHHADVDAVWILAPHELSIGLEILGALLPPHAASGRRDRDGAVALAAQLGTQPWHAFSVDAAAPRRRAVSLHCRDGVATLPDAESPHLLITRPGRAPDARPLEREWPLRRSLRTFLAHLAGGPPPRSSAADGAAVVATLAALRRRAGLDAA